MCILEKELFLFLFNCSMYCDYTDFCFSSSKSSHLSKFQPRFCLCWYICINKALLLHSSMSQSLVSHKPWILSMLSCVGFCSSPQFSEHQRNLRININNGFNLTFIHLYFTKLYYFIWEVSSVFYQRKLSFKELRYMPKITHFLNSRSDTWILVSYSLSYTLPWLRFKSSLIRNVFQVSTLLSFPLSFSLSSVYALRPPSQSNCLWLGWQGHMVLTDKSLYNTCTYIFEPLPRMILEEWLALI